MRLIIAGSRFDERTELEARRRDACKELDKICINDINEVVSGTAAGYDRVGEWWAQAMAIPVTRFRADWNTYGKGAGYRRNVEMGTYADEALVFWDGQSKGSKHMIDIMEKLGKPVRVVNV